jgi:hypothetical protein
MRRRSTPVEVPARGPAVATRKAVAPAAQPDQAAVVRRAAVPAGQAKLAARPATVPVKRALGPVKLPAIGRDKRAETGPVSQPVIVPVKLEETDPERAATDPDKAPATEAAQPRVISQPEAGTSLSAVAARRLFAAMDRFAPSGLTA